MKNKLTLIIFLLTVALFVAKTARAEQEFNCTCQCICVQAGWPMLASGYAAIINEYDSCPPFDWADTCQWSCIAQKYDGGALMYCSEWPLVYGSVQSNF